MRDNAKALFEINELGLENSTAAILNDTVHALRQLGRAKVEVFDCQLGWFAILGDAIERTIDARLEHPPNPSNKTAIALAVARLAASTLAMPSDAGNLPINANEIGKQATAIQIALTCR